MKIRHLSIRNFRGIRALDCAMPANNLFCLIGRGDTTKSSILEAIRYALFPMWTLSLDVFDFFGGDTTKPICITVTLGDLPEEFHSDAKYGHVLRGWDSVNARIVDEPGERLEEIISARLTVDGSFEPKWTVVCDRRDEGVTFTVADRQKARATFIGTYADRHLTWGKNTALSRLTKSENIAAALANAAAAAKAALDDNRATNLTKFDAAAKAAEKIARIYGVPVSEEGAYRANLDTAAVNIQLGGLSLHDKQIPVRTLGLGSRRMLTFGIEQNNLEEPHITLIDEIEIGLEPHRIARLLKHLKGDGKGQYFLTTHSPVVLRELTVEDLYTVQSAGHETKVIAAAVPGLSEIIQGKVRAGAEAFLAANVIVCEGATEVGLGRGLDNLWMSAGGDPFSYTGTALFDANGGSNVRSAAEAFVKLGYRVAAIVDSDAEDNFTEADEQALEALGVCVVRWDGGVSIEQYLFLNLPWDKAIASVGLARELRGDSVIEQVKHYYAGVDGDVTKWKESADLRRAIAKASMGNAKRQNAWFKRQSSAEQWTSVIADCFDAAGTPLHSKIDKLKKWVFGG